MRKIIIIPFWYNIGLDHTVAILSPEGSKTFVFVHQNLFPKFQLEVRGMKSIVYGQYGQNGNKAHHDNNIGWVSNDFLTHFWENGI